MVGQTELEVLAAERQRKALRRTPKLRARSHAVLASTGSVQGHATDTTTFGTLYGVLVDFGSTVSASCEKIASVCSALPGFRSDSLGSEELASSNALEQVRDSLQSLLRSLAKLFANLRDAQVRHRLDSVELPACIVSDMRQIQNNWLDLSCRIAASIVCVQQANQCIGDPQSQSFTALHSVLQKHLYLCRRERMLLERIRTIQKELRLREARIDAPNRREAPAPEAFQGCSGVLRQTRSMQNEERTSKSPKRCAVRTRLEISAPTTPNLPTAGREAFFVGAVNEAASRSRCSEALAPTPCLFRLFERSSATRQHPGSVGEHLDGSRWTSLLHHSALSSQWQILRFRSEGFHDEGSLQCSHGSGSLRVLADSLRTDAYHYAANFVGSPCS
jgi:hypothetical protein